ncbi:hypothetical protein F511_05628 [Dorcoceras hygrometricum]|uniref:Uncharacterized protein n=1 Tax=Dorcoceras hygrometricum TaxID=472368 RepID=A0A2Z7CZ47_9LAMI|nr:hypothetical protein F511_05628 [Dorcoceras hygrometricum]
MQLIQVKRLGPGKFYISNKKELGFIGGDRMSKDDMMKLLKERPTRKGPPALFIQAKGRGRPLRREERGAGSAIMRRKPQSLLGQVLLRTRSRSRARMGFNGCLAQFRANGYSKEEHSASFLDVEQALADMPEESEESSSGSKESPPS